MTGDPLTLAQVGVSGKQIVLWSLRCRMFTGGALGIDSCGGGRRKQDWAEGATMPAQHSLF